MIVAPSASSERATASRSASTVARRFVGAVRTAPRPRAKSSPCGVATCSSNASPSPATGRKWKIPPPSLLSSTIVSLQPEPARRQQPADVVGERDVADQQHDRTARRGGRAEGRGHGAVDPVGAAVGQDPRAARSRAAKNSSTSRIGIEEATNSVALGGQPIAQRAGDRAARSARRQSGSAIARATGAVGGAPAVEPVLARHDLVGARRSRQSARASRRSADDAARGPASARRGRTGSGRMSASDPSQLRSGLDVGRSPIRHTTRAVSRAANAGIAQEQVEVGDRRRAAARAGERVGEQRDPAPARRRRPAGCRARVGLAAAGDEHRRAGTRGGAGRAWAALGCRRAGSSHGRPSGRRRRRARRRAAARRGPAARAAGS